MRNPVGWLIAIIMSGLGILVGKKASDKSSEGVRSMGMESWRSLMTQLAGDIPVGYLMTYALKESGGRACAIGSPPALGGQPIENGIFQLYHTDKFATPAQLRTACVLSVSAEVYKRLPTEVLTGIKKTDIIRNSMYNDRLRKAWETQVRPLTEDEKILQVKSGIQMINRDRNSVRTWFAKAGMSWNEKSSDFWKIVKFAHGLPAFLALLPYLTTKRGSPIPNWETFKTELTNTTLDDFKKVFPGNYQSNFSYKAGALPRTFAISEIVGNAAVPSGNV